MKPQSLFDDPRFPLHWQMSAGERLAVVWILDRVRPKLSLEIGTYLGGSLQAIAAFSERVVSFDADPTVPERLGPRFPNVEFCVGPSVETLPVAVAAMNETENTPELVLIDGDHSTDGVRNDIEALLRLRPRRELIILMHDSFNPDCRRGMLAADWESSPFVHGVEIDFVPGNYFPVAFDTAAAGSMWSGLACAVMRPAERRGQLTIQQSGLDVYEAVLARSAHAVGAKKTTRDPVRQRLLAAVKRIKRAGVGARGLNARKPG